MSDDQAYEAYLKRAQEAHEALCRRCGACCGVYEHDPCVHLIEEFHGRYACSIYEERFGLRKTKNGEEFMCVPARNVLPGSWVGSWRCGYKK